MSGTIDIGFLHRYEWSASDHNFTRPYCLISIFDNSSSAVYPVWSLVDTGADRIQLDADIGVNAGYDVFHPDNIVTANIADGSSAQFFKVKGITVEIEGVPIVEDILFQKNAPNLLGRRAFLKAIEIGVDKDGWLFKYL